MLGGVLRPWDSSASGDKDQGLLCLSTHHKQVCHSRTCMWGLWRRGACHVLVAGWLRAQQWTKSSCFSHIQQWFCKEKWQRKWQCWMLGGSEIFCRYLTWTAAPGETLSSVWVVNVKSGSRLHGMMIQGRCFRGLPVNWCSKKYSMEHFFHYLWLKRHWFIMSQSTVSHHILKSKLWSNKQFFI